MPLRFKLNAETLIFYIITPSSGLEPKSTRPLIYRYRGHVSKSVDAKFMQNYFKMKKR